MVIKNSNGTRLIKRLDYNRADKNVFTPFSDILPKSDNALKEELYYCWENKKAIFFMGVIIKRF